MQAGCSSTPATGCARRSRHPVVLSTPPCAAQLALELPVRMGIATGEAELRGADYFGAVLNRAARVMSAGHGGQILLDGVTAGLLSDVDLIDVGTSGVCATSPNPLSCFRSVQPGLRTEFPPLKTPGRDTRELAAANHQLCRARVRTSAEVCGGAESTPAGDVDRRRRRREDAAGAGGCRAVGTRLPRRRMADRAGPGRLIPQRCPTPSPPCSESCSSRG